jgi:hypothetical protein
MSDGLSADAVHVLCRGDDGCGDHACAACYPKDPRDETIARLAAENAEMRKERDEIINATILGPLAGKTAHDEIVTLRVETERLHDEAHGRIMERDAALARVAELERVAEALRTSLESATLDSVDAFHSEKVTREQLGSIRPRRLRGVHARGRGGGEVSGRMTDAQLVRVESDADTCRGYYARHGVLPTSTGLDVLDRVPAILAELRERRARDITVQERSDLRYLLLLLVKHYDEPYAYQGEEVERAMDVMDGLLRERLEAQEKTP